MHMLAFCIVSSWLLLACTEGASEFAQYGELERPGGSTEDGIVDLGDSADPEGLGRKTMANLGPRRSGAPALGKEGEIDPAGASLSQKTAGASAPRLEHVPGKPLGETAQSATSTALLIQECYTLLDNVPKAMCTQSRTSDSFVQRACRGKSKEKEDRCQAALKTLKEGDVGIVRKLTALQEEVAALKEQLKNSKEAERKGEAEKNKMTEQIAALKKKGASPGTMKGAAKSAKEEAVQLENEGPPQAAGATQLNCEASNYGFMDPVTRKFNPKKWSSALAVGFQGNSQRSEQYQVSPPGCDPPVCKSRPADKSSLKALKVEQCASDAADALPDVVLSAGMDQNMVVTQAGVIAGWGSDANKKISGAPADTKFTTVSAGQLHSCGVTREKSQMKCWGWDGLKQGTKGMTIKRGQCGGSSYCAGLATNTKFTAVATGYLHTCAITMDKEEVKCWGRDRYFQVSGMTKKRGKCGKTSYCAGLAANTKFAVVSAGNLHTCAITKQEAAINCWGRDRYFQVSGMTGKRGKCGKTSYCAGLSASTKFTVVSAGAFHTCGITRSGAEAKCWGNDFFMQVSGMTMKKGEGNKKNAYCAGLAASTKFIAVAAGPAPGNLQAWGPVSHTCAITMRKQEMKCWGWDQFKQASGMTRAKGPCGGEAYCAGLASSTAFIAVSIGEAHSCGVTKEPMVVACWGRNIMNQAAVPSKSIKWTTEPSCHTLATPRILLSI
jgi:hypothetical protein